jgi:dTMP kinase
MDLHGRLEPNPYPGKLIVFDGMQRAGKSTVARRFGDELRARGIPFVWTEWNSHPPLRAIIDEKKWSNTLTPRTWSALHFADFVVRYEEIVRPALQAGTWVIADRYVYTAFSRDVLKGLSADYVHGCYRFAVRPDAVLFFLVTPETALERHRQFMPQMHAYNSGRDIFGDEGDPAATYLKYQTLVRESYLRMAEQHDALVVDGEAPPEACYEMARSYMGARLQMAAAPTWPP